MIEAKENLTGVLNISVVNIPPKNQEKEAAPSKISQEITPDKPYTGLSKVTIKPVTSEIDSNIVSNNIKDGVEILGVTGNVVELKGEELEVTPTKESQTFIPSDGKNGFTNVEVGKIPDEYIVPSGELEITSNGTYDVTEKASATVNVPKPIVGDKTITSNGTYKSSDDNLYGYSDVVVDVPEKELGTKTITSNGVYNASDDNLDGYSSVNVETSGVDINEYFQIPNYYGYFLARIVKKIPNNFVLDLGGKTNYNNLFQSGSSLEEIPLFDTSKATSINSMFSDCSKIKSIPLFDFSKVTSMSTAFSNCSSLISIPEINTSNCNSFSTVFSGCSNLQNIPKLDFSKIRIISSAFNSTYNLTTLGGFENLGKAYLTTVNANYSSYTLDLSSSMNLTHDSLMNVINNLYDIASAGVKSQKLVLGSTNLAKLTSDEIAIAQNKGWTVS